MDELHRSLERLLADEPDNHAVRLHLAQMLLADGQAAASLGHCETILRADAEHVGAQALAGDARAALAGSLPTPTDPSSSPPPATTRPSTPSAPAGPAPTREPSWSDDVSPESIQVPVAGSDDDAVHIDDLYELIRPEVSLDDVAGMEAVKERIRVSFLEPMRNEELRRMYGATMSSGLLLYGPPGCGKTFIARALAGELGLYFVSAGLSDLLDRWLGNSEKLLHELFETARRNAPTVLFLDEVDVIGHRRTGMRGDSGLRSMVNQLLLELDGVDADNEGVLVLGATNQPWDIDPALRRPGRFDRQILVLPPDLSARAAVLAGALKDRPVGEVDVAAIAAVTDGYSGADLSHVVTTASEFAMTDSVRTGTPRPIDQSDLVRAVDDVAPSTGPWFESARPYAQFSNNAGEYDELLEYLDSRGSARPRKRRFR